MFKYLSLKYWMTPKKYRFKAPKRGKKFRARVVAKGFKALPQ